VGHVSGYSIIGRGGWSCRHRSLPALRLIKTDQRRLEIAIGLRARGTRFCASALLRALAIASPPPRCYLPQYLPPPHAALAPRCTLCRTSRASCTSFLSAFYPRARTSSPSFTSPLLSARIAATALGRTFRAIAPFSRFRLSRRGDVAGIKCEDSSRVVDVDGVAWICGVISHGETGMA